MINGSDFSFPPLSPYFSEKDMLIGLDSIYGLVKGINKAFSLAYNLKDIMLLYWDDKLGPTCHSLSATQISKIEHFDDNTKYVIVNNAISACTVNSPDLAKNYRDTAGNNHRLLTYFFDVPDSAARRGIRGFAVTAEILEEVLPSQELMIIKELADTYFPISAFHVEVDNILKDLKKDEASIGEMRTDEEQAFLEQDLSVMCSPEMPS